MSGHDCVEWFRGFDGVYRCPECQKTKPGTAEKET